MHSARFIAVLWLLLLIGSTALLEAQTKSYILQPGLTGQDAFLDSRIPDSPNGDTPEFSSCSWTVQGTPVVNRSLVRFNLSFIPAGTRVRTALLTLHNNPTASIGFLNGEHSSSSTNTNASLIRKILQPWSEATVTWNSQPPTTAVGQIYLAPSSTPHQDYTIVITDMVQEMVDAPHTNFGFMLQLQTELQYACLVFASSDHANPLLHPSLEIILDADAPVNPLCKELIMRTESSTTEDALVNNLLPDVNDAASPECNALAWVSADKSQQVMRSYMRFDLRSIPNGAKIQEALLILNNNSVSFSARQDGAHLHISGSNDAVIHKVQQPWDETTITWNNQPQQVSGDSVMVNASTSAHQNYALPLLNYIQYWLNKPDSNFGIRLKLLRETGARCLLFASSDHNNTLLRPQLQLCYLLPQPTEVGITESPTNITATPNPFTQQCRIHLPDALSNTPLRISIYDTFGRVVRILFDGLAQGSNLSFAWDSRCDAGELVAAGVYYVSIVNGGKFQHLAIIKE